MRRLSQLTNLGIFLVQGAFAVMFFYGLGSTWWEGGLLASLGVLLELVKRQTWIEFKSRAAQGAILSLVFALILSCFSGMASVAFSYTSIQTSVKNAEDQQGQSLKLETELVGLEEEASSIRAKLSVLPGDWVTSSLRYSERLKSISSEKGVLLTQLGGMGGSGAIGTGAATMKAFCLLLGLNYSLVLIFFMGTLAFILEVATFKMIHGKKTVVQVSRTSLNALVLQTSFQTPEKALLGRRPVALELKMSETDIRDVFAKIHQQGWIETRKGKRGYFLKGTLAEAIEGLTPLI